MRLRALALVLLVLGLAGCSAGGGEDADEVLAETAERLGEIRSGDLDLSMVVTPREGGEFGFEIRGPFALARPGQLPQLEVEYTQIANGNRATVTLISTGKAAYVRIGDSVRELPPEQASELREAVQALGGDEGLEQFAIDDWIAEGDVSDGEELGGAETDKVEGDLDIVATVNGLAELAGGLGRPVPQIEGESAEQLRDATESATFELYTGEEDRLLRRLDLRAEFALDVPQELRTAFGDVVGATIRFRLGVADPNKQVTVEDPTE